MRDSKCSEVPSGDHRVQYVWCVYPSIIIVFLVFIEVKSVIPKLPLPYKEDKILVLAHDKFKWVLETLSDTLRLSNAYAIARKATRYAIRKEDFIPFHTLFSFI